MAEFQFTTAAWVALAILVAAVAVALALLAYVVRHARASPAPVAAPEPRALAPGESATLEEVLAGGAAPDRYLMRFVLDAAGARVGETITVHEGAMILKREGRFAAIPLAAIVARDDTLTLAGDVDWDAADRAGEAWRRAGENALRFDEKGNPIG